MPTGIDPKTNRSPRFRDLTGQKIGMLTVISLNEIRKKYTKGDGTWKTNRSSRTYWNVVCDCGREKKMETGCIFITQNCGKHKPKGLENPRVKDYTGMIFGKLKVIKYAGSETDIPKTKKTGKNMYHSMWECLCECGNIKIIRSGSLHSGGAKSCGCETRRPGRRSPKWKGSRLLSASFWGTLTHGAKSMDREVTITPEDVEALYEKQGRRCAMTKIPIDFGNLDIRHADRKVTASVDRIDSSIGYTKENIQIVHRDINWMKNIYSKDYFIEMCKLVARNN